MAKRVQRAIQSLGASAFGLAIAAGVFFGLTQLSTGGDGPIVRIRAREIKFTRLVVDSQTFTKPHGPRPLLPAPTPQRPAPAPTSGRCDSCAPLLMKVALTERGPERVPGPRNLMTSGTDTGPIPLVRILPEYPPNGRGDGWVLMQFDISPTGAVVNTQVIDASPRGVFERSALRAISRWRYRPAVVEGQAVERRGVQVKLSFHLEQA